MIQTEKGTPVSAALSSSELRRTEKPVIRRSTIHRGRRLEAERREQRSCSRVEAGLNRRAVGGRRARDQQTADGLINSPSS